MSILFIADVHICIQEPRVVDGFLRFLRTRATSATALYILGDLFETWIGDDNLNYINNEIASALRSLNKQGIPCYFIHGNRDFLLGQNYADSCGMKLLPTQQTIQFYGIRIVILHGDLLCIKDVKYQCFRRLTNQRWIQKLFLSLPLKVRLKIANKLRNISIKVNSNKKSVIDVDMQTVMMILTHTKAKIMIHGHTHKPDICLLPGGCMRAVLGAWHDQGSIIEVNSEEVKLLDFPFIN